MECLRCHWQESQVWQLGGEKAKYLEMAIAEIYWAETVRKLQKWDASSVGLDVSSINKEREHEVVVKRYLLGIELGHYKTSTLESLGQGSN